MPFKFGIRFDTGEKGGVDGMVRVLGLNSKSHERAQEADSSKERSHVDEARNNAVVVELHQDVHWSRFPSLIPLDLGRQQHTLIHILSISA